MSLADDLEKEFGGNDDFNESSSFLDTGFKPLNKILSGVFYGGIPRGRIIEMFGPSSSGKTALSTQLMIETQ
jgi:recombination protein RecA